MVTPSRVPLRMRMDCGATYPPEVPVPEWLAPRAVMLIVPLIVRSPVTYRTVNSLRTGGVKVALASIVREPSTTTTAGRVSTTDEKKSVAVYPLEIVREPRLTT